MECKNFESFDDLKLTKSLGLNVYTFTKLKLMPNKKIIFQSETYAFRYVQLAEDCEITLENFLGFDFFGNPFDLPGAKRSRLIIYDSYLDFYSQDGDKLDAASCDSINKDDIYVTIFDACSSVKLTESVYYTPDFCPAVLKVSIRSDT